MGLLWNQTRHRRSLKCYLAFSGYVYFGICYVIVVFNLFYLTKNRHQEHGIVYKLSQDLTIVVVLRVSSGSIGKTSEEKGQNLETVRTSFALLRRMILQFARASFRGLVFFLNDPKQGMLPLVANSISPRCCTANRNQGGLL